MVIPSTTGVARQELREERGAARSARLWLEMAALFGLLPLLAYGARAAGLLVPVIPLLVAVALGLSLALGRDPGFEWSRALRTPLAGGELRRIALLLLPGMAALTALVLALEPARLLHLPREQPLLWAMILLLYPLLSVVPQEVVFRLYFFHRYAPILPRMGTRIAASALAFGLAHVVYGHLLSVLLSAVGGALFGWTYARTRSLGLVSIEHALYGCAIFTLGLGGLFYSGTV